MLGIIIAVKNGGMKLQLQNNVDGEEVVVVSCIIHLGLRSVTGLRRRVAALWKSDFLRAGL